MCGRVKNEIGSHGLVGTPTNMTSDDDSNLGIPLTSCGGFYTLFFKEPMDISAINKVVGNILLVKIVESEK